MEEPKEIIDDEYYLDISDEDEVYTFKSLDNKKRPKEKQMRANIKALSGKDVVSIGVRTRRDVLEYMNDKGLCYDKKLFNELYNEFSQKWEFVLRIRSLENIKYKKNGVKNELTDPLELYEFNEARFAVLTQELSLHFLGYDNFEEKVKN